MPVIPNIHRTAVPRGEHVKQGLRARDLSKRLNVTEARVSQMFGEQAKNLTLKTIARIFYHLNETPYITTQEEFDRIVADARGDYVADGAPWTIRGIVDDLQVAPDITVDQTEANLDAVVTRKLLNRWMQAEEEQESKPRRLAAVG